MSLAFVQSQKVNGSGTIVFPAITVTAGNTLYVWARCGGTITISDDKSNTWAACARDGSNNYPVAIAAGNNIGLYQATNCAAGSTTITVTCGAGVSRAVVLEFSGLQTASVQDQAAFTDNQGANPIVSPTTNTRDTADELLLGLFYDDGASSVFTAGTNLSWTIPANGVAGIKVAMEYVIVSATGTERAEMSNSVTPLHAFGGIATFRMASAAILPGKSLVVCQAVNRAGTY
jgi:hypothetical protein